jgi:hypothetical protein
VYSLSAGRQVWLERVLQIEDERAVKLYEDFLFSPIVRKAHGLREGDGEGVRISQEDCGIGKDVDG